MVRAMASSRTTKRGKQTIATTASIQAPPIQTEGYDDEYVFCYYFTPWIRAHKFKRTLLDNGAVVELINFRKVKELQLKTYSMEEDEVSKLANDEPASVSEYFWVPVKRKNRPGGRGFLYGEEGRHLALLLPFSRFFASSLCQYSHYSSRVSRLSPHQYRWCSPNLSLTLWYLAIGTVTALDATGSASFITIHFSQPSVAYSQRPPPPHDMCFHFVQFWLTGPQCLRRGRLRRSKCGSRP